MAKKNIILVSGSPRRKELLKDMGLNFTVDAKTYFSEDIPVGMKNEDIPAYFAEQKSLHYHKSITENDILISADTVVICDGQLMGKPRHRGKAKEMLSRLSGKTHQVISAVSVRSKDKCITRTDTTLVTFRTLEASEINSYVEDKRPVDKAGGYGIQDWIGLVGITGIEGSYYTVKGLPTHLLYQILKEFL